MIRKLFKNNVEYREFCRLSILSDFENDVLEYSVKKDFPVYRIALELNCSEATVNRTLKRIAEKYDSVSEISPILETRPHR